jgi:tetratricopeptide (TPR) repeat protein
VKKKKFAKVVSLLQENVELDPKDPVNHYKLGLIHEFNKDYDEAIPSYKRAIELKNDNAKSLNALGRVYMKSGRLDEAKETLELAKKADPKLEETNVLLGNIRDEISPEPQVYRKKSYSSGKKKSSKRDSSARKGKKASKRDSSATKGKKSKKSSKSVAKKKSSSGEKSKKSTSVAKKSNKSSKGKKKK